MQQLVVEGKNIDAIGPESDRTALHYHAARGNTHSVQALLQAGADITKTDHFGNKPLHCAAKRRFREIADLFFEHGTENDIVTAACLGMMEEIKRILKADKDSVHRGIAGWTPLHVAAQFGLLEIAEILLDSGAEVNRLDFGGVGLTPLHRAAAQGRRDVVHLLLSRGAEVNIRGDATPRETAIEVARRLQPHDDELLWLLL